MVSHMPPFSTTWFIVRWDHMCQHDCSLCDLRVASPSCPPGRVSPRIPDNAVKFKGLWGALLVCLSVASSRQVSQKAGTSPFVSAATPLQCST